MTSTTTALNLDAIAARIEDCKTYNFGLRNADRLAHEDAPAMLAEVRLGRELKEELDDVRSALKDMLYVAEADGLEKAKSHAIKTARIAARSRNAIMATIREASNSVIEAHGKRVGTHHAGCWKRHVACFATIVRDLIEQTEGAGSANV